MMMPDVYSKLAEAEEDIQTGHLLNADTALNRLREKYRV